MSQLLSVPPPTPGHPASHRLARTRGAGWHLVPLVHVVHVIRRATRAHGYLRGPRPWPAEHAVATGPEGTRSGHATTRFRTAKSLTPSWAPHDWIHPRWPSHASSEDGRARHQATTASGSTRAQPLPETSQVATRYALESLSPE